MGQIEFHAVSNAPLFRKIAFGSWRTVGDPSVYGAIEIDVTKAKAFIEKYSSEVKLTYTHLVGASMAQVLRDWPEINGMIRLGKIYRREQVDIFFQVNVPGNGQGNEKIKNANLAGAVVRNASKLNVIQLARELYEKAESLRQSKDNEYNRAVALFKHLPWCLSRYLLNITSFFNYDLNLNLTSLGVPRDPFGSVMITNVGSLGIEQGWAPLVPYSRVPLLLTLGAIRDRAWVVDGKIEVRPILHIGITFDHRFMDGVHASAMAKKFKEFFEQPERLLENTK